ncbi:unnamed protein product [Chondrus crispus]|uniref:HTH CENPB-type domain-containing protein n=1 Tax=Chondrus crispus TaxID=2769 RepID=R7QTS7_CHOCR|nr:unnamed protein product [Chondrus crispus]CDF41108.1 unnamed protein product [Chondrus crispus]|eukprot:XP_005711402.1 unnamed protein product [Chondrus crispus]
MAPVPEKTKATRKRLTHIAEARNRRSARLLDNGYRTTAVMRQFGIAERTVRNIKATAPALLRVVNQKPQSLQAKTRQSIMVPHLELKLLEFLNYARSAKMPVTQTVLQTRALMIKEQMLKFQVTGKDRTTLDKFTASRGWVEKFVKRHALRSVALHGEGGQVQVQEVAKDINILRSRLRNFEPENIYNVDETGLFFKLLPRRSACGAEST